MAERLNALKKPNELLTRMTKQEIKKKEQELLNLTGAFCTQHLNEEYLLLCEKLVKKLGRKKEVPFQRGKLEIWAAAVVYALGSINFLFDKESQPHVPSTFISEFFEVNPTTVSQKAKLIKDLFGMWHFSPEFSTQQMADKNPLNNLVLVDGYMVPLNSLPVELQQEVRAARAAGGDLQFRTE